MLYILSARSSNHVYSKKKSSISPYIYPVLSKSKNHRPGVVLQGQVFQGLHQASLHVARLGRLHGGVDQTFASFSRGGGWDDGDDGDDGTPQRSQKKQGTFQGNLVIHQRIYRYMRISIGYLIFRQS